MALKESWLLVLKLDGEIPESFIVLEERYTEVGVGICVGVGAGDVPGVIGGGGDAGAGGLAGG